MPVARNSSLTLSFILVTILLDMIGLGIILPVLPQLILELTGDSVAKSAVMGGYLVFVYALLQFIFSPVLGNLSDRFGRRPILLLSLLGLTADYLLMGFAPTLGWLFVGRALAGISGAAVATATAYIADITPPEKRSQRFGLIGAAFGLGFIIGPVVGGELGEFSPRAPFYAAAALAFANFLFGFFILPESLNIRKRRRFDIKRANPLGAILAFRPFPVILWLLGTLFLFSLASQTYPSVWNFFTIERFDWSSSQIGRSLAVFGLLFALVQGVLIGPVVRRFGESSTVILGMLAASIAFFGTSFIHTPVGLYFYLVIGAFSGLAAPAINGLLSRQIPDNAQGELQGAVNATNSLTAIIGPLAATQLFSYFTTSPQAPGYFPGVSFFAAGILVIVAFLVFVYAVRRFHLRRLEEPESRTRIPDIAKPGEIAVPPRAENKK
ncbi:MAG TPA: MFS transporter [Devosia sp.]|nr:MFS transporter [Devosia sp.]